MSRIATTFAVLKAQGRKALIPFVTAGDPHPGATVDWDALAKGPGTLVLLMAVTHLERVAQELVKRGRDEQTPVAVISDGTTPRQRVLVSTLAEVAVDARAAGVRPPAVVVVGDVVRLRDVLSP